MASWRPAPMAVGGAALAAGMLTRRAAPTIAITILTSLSVARAIAAHDAVAPDELGPFEGWVTVVDDPQPRPKATRVILEVGGERFETWVRGRASRLRVDRWQSGDLVWVVGEREPLAGERAGRVRWQHVVGEFEADVLGDRLDGARVDVASNRVRDLIVGGTSPLPPADAALARGLIIGDDRDQPQDMLERFRASGLAHLTAVSGQNVVFVIAAAGPLLRRLRPGPRLAVSIILIGWFVLLTRAEPSVLRAGVMAGLAAVAFATGREREPPRLLAVAVIVLVLADPLIVGSIGFWLSVGATGGVTIIGAPLRARLRLLGPLATPVAMTVGAQMGVAVPSILVFGRLPLAGTVANLFAVPVAGLVMLYGLPAAIVGGLVPALAGPLMLPVRAAVRWVDSVAAVAARAEPAPPWNAVGWAVLLLFLALVCLAAGDRDDATMASPWRSTS